MRLSEGSRRETRAGQALKDGVKESVKAGKGKKHLGSEVPRVVGVVTRVRGENRLMQEVWV